MSARPYSSPSRPGPVFRWIDALAVCLGTFMGWLYAKLGADIRAQQRMADALRDTAYALSGTLDYEELLDRIMMNAGSVVPHDAACIMLLDGDTLYVVRSRGYAAYGATRELDGTRVPLALLPRHRRMLDDDRPHVARDTRTFDWSVLPHLNWIASFVAAPIHVRGRIIGFMDMDSARPAAFREADAARLQAFADQVGSAIESARLYAEVKWHADRLEERVAARTEELCVANMALQQLATRAQELDRLKSQFVSNVTHELRTPLTNIKLYLSLLENGKPDKQAAYIETLKREAGLLQKLIEDLLDLSRFDLGKVKPALEPTDLNRLVEELAGDRRQLIEDHGLELRMETARGLGVIAVDPRMIKQVLTNLMTNAMNYTPAGGRITIRTEAATHADRPGVALSVADNGIGISADDQAHVFERFYRGAAAQGNVTPGAGLGLPICGEIIHLHGGEITLVSAEGAGATVTVWLPYEAEEGLARS